jgi:hypothetical protein
MGRIGFSFLISEPLGPSFIRLYLVEP